MTLKGSINMATATLIAISLLFAFFTWSSKSWIEGVNAQMLVEERRFTEIQPKIAKIETEGQMHWAEVDRRLAAIESKIDRVLSK